MLLSLQKFSDIGYDGVELMGTATGGLKLTDFKQLLADLNLDPISSHGLQGEQDYAFAQSLGVRYTDIRAHLADTSRDAVLRACDELNENGRLRHKFGLKAVLHNHSQEFRFLKDDAQTRVYDLFVQNTDPEFVNFELDVGWCAFAGADPASVVRQYPGRFPLIHVKETSRTAMYDHEMEHFPPEMLALGPPQPPRHPLAGKTGIARGISFFSEEQAMMLYRTRDWNVRLGRGIIIWTKLVKACEAQGTVAYINEREFYGYPGGQDDAATCALQDYEFLRSL